MSPHYHGTAILCPFCPKAPRVSGPVFMVQGLVGTNLAHAGYLKKAPGRSAADVLNLEFTRQLQDELQD